MTVEREAIVFEIQIQSGSIWLSDVCVFVWIEAPPPTNSGIVSVLVFGFLFLVKEILPRKSCPVLDEESISNDGERRSGSDSEGGGGVKSEEFELESEFNCGTRLGDRGGGAKSPRRSFPPLPTLRFVSSSTRSVMAATMV